jgi:hypothetical protein
LKNGGILTAVFEKSTDLTAVFEKRLKSTDLHRLRVFGFTLIILHSRVFNFEKSTD